MVNCFGTKPSDNALSLLLPAYLLLAVKCKVFVMISSELSNLSLSMFVCVCGGGGGGGGSGSTICIVQLYSVYRIAGKFGGSGEK